MKLIFRNMRNYLSAVIFAVFLKLLATISELTLPYILEYIIDTLVPAGILVQVFLWGCLMFAAALCAWLFNVIANRRAIDTAHRVSYDIRQELFQKTVNLNGPQFDSVGLPSLISRMTSDSYNVQSAVQQLQSLCIRAPMMLFGGLLMTMLMDFHLSCILIVMLPFLIAVTILVSYRGIPMFHTVQRKLDSVVRIMRENITGIRVVKALSKTEYEKKRFAQANHEMAQCDIAAGTVMAIPGPFMQTCLNAGLTLVVLIGAQRVNNGQLEPGVILAFLTYFNMITQGVMGLNRIFLSMSKASASADRIREVLAMDTEQKVLPLDQAPKPEGDEFLRFEHVSFNYGSTGLAGNAREKALDDISFAVRKGESLGIIGPTGCGKTTIINLLMNFYDADTGAVFVDGRDVRTYPKDELHRKFGVAFQNDMIFQDTLGQNIRFGRDLSEEDAARAAEDAMAGEYIRSLDQGLDYQADIRGANLSGGQKQRILVARALAANPEILVLDDSSSALDYKTDAAMRSAIHQNYGSSTLVLIAQRVSSVMGLTHILVMDNGKCIGYGSHKELLNSCRAYREIYEAQMGAMV
ncbi:MAG: ABC transporter ATP-binding protein [Faecousia sp.]